MNELEIAKNALKQIVGYYRRSHKHGKNTCYMMCLEAEKALQEMSLLSKRAADGRWACRNCGRENDDGFKFCSRCNTARR